MAFEPTALDVTESKLSAPEVGHLEWSRWARCQSSLSLALVPPLPGIFALAEEVIAENESPLTGQRRMIAVFDIQETDDLARTLHGLFSAASELRPRLQSGRCFVRYAVVPVRTQRQAAAHALRNWLAATSESASAVTDGFTASSPSATHQEDKEQQEIGKPSFPEGF
ncbi:MAG TPA: hypothetical protein VMS96_05330 [Terriglobales bacterium]|nr:hypothetical protein [Terriglobales bacterium]